MAVLLEKKKKRTATSRKSARSRQIPVVISYGETFTG
jgi:hypothetical protein